MLYMNNVTDLFLNAIRFLSDKDLSNNVVIKARACLLDYLGVTIAGAKLLKEKKQVLLDSQENGNVCHIIGSSNMDSSSIAALINGICAHEIELDDGHRIGMLHLGAPIISAVLAVSEKENLPTDDFIKGIVIGYEVAIRLASAVQPGNKLKGYHATGTCGTIGAAMGIAAALHFDFEQMKSAFSAAVTSAAGLLEMIEGDTELKPFNAGRAAMDGVVAAYIGKSRFKAPDDALGGKRGFLSVMTDVPEMEYLTDFTPGKYMIETIYKKPYAACRHCHPSIEAALHIRTMEGFRIDEIVSIDVETYKLAIAGHDHTVIQGVNSSKMSIPYSLAVALYTGKAGLSEFTESVISNPAVKALTEKVVVSENKEFSALCPQKRIASVTVKTSTGVFVERIDYPKGEPENPLSRQELEDKFRGLATYGGLTSNECEEVINEVWKDDFDLKRIMNIVSK